MRKSTVFIASKSTCKHIYVCRFLDVVIIVIYLFNNSTLTVAEANRLVRGLGWRMKVVLVNELKFNLLVRTYVL